MTDTNLLQEFESFIDKRIIIGRIETVDEELGVIEVSYTSMEGYKTFNIPHPHFGTTSWVRSMPEVGTYVLVGMTQYRQYPEILKTFDPSERVRIALNHVREIKPDPNPDDPKEISPVDRIERASGRPNGLPFRKLRAGEHEIMSKGKSSIWISRRGYSLEKAGIVRRAVDSEKSTIQDWAAGHERLGLDATLQNQLWDSDYFGLVRRPSTDSTTLPLSPLLNATAIQTQITANIHIEDNVSSKLATQKSSQAQLVTEYNQKVQALKTAGNTALSSTQDLSVVSNQSDTLRKSALELDKTFDGLNFSMGQLKIIGAAFQYVQEDFDIAQAAIRTQKELVVDLCGKINKIVETNSPNILTDAKEVFIQFSELIVIPIPVYTPEESITNAFASQNKQEASIAAKLAEAQAESQIYLENALQVSKKFVYTEPKLENNEFCKEWRTSVSWKSLPGTLYEQVIGHVYDNRGIRETNPITGKKTRSRRTWWADKPNEAKSGVEWIDSDGNLIHFLAASAKKGRHVVVPEGSDYLDVGGDAELRTGGDRTEKVGGGRKILVVKDLVIEAENVYYKVRGKYQVDATEIILNQDVNSIQKMTRPIQQTSDTTYSTGEVIQSSVVTSEKILVNADPKRRFVLGNPLISARQKEIEDALTNVGSLQASFQMTSGNITSKADHNIVDEAKELVVSKAKKGIVQQTDGNAVRTAKKAILDSAKSAVYPRLHGKDHTA
jgi:hypothetical protein